MQMVFSKFNRVKICTNILVFAVNRVDGRVLKWIISLLSKLTGPGQHKVTGFKTDRQK